ncbi:histidine phosphatase family protein [Rhizorhapis suberifaciens]|uniref:Broad specificity phosphatase PhoE n=1 Tax=Rhizorhapis suberifaciens TaxID=13656 RepID=A0A840HV26_9SPHN|nr:histidine phosphatase family protein [Rhizorhapis suberifaciens]MBB4641905.1 broad specificity phosphatase PhoE [Rhizorhapis suberifaciens]
MRFFLIRHGEHDALDRVLCGRTLDLSLNETGRRRSDLLGAALAEHQPILQCSPRKRARETAERMAQSCGGIPQIVSALDEIDFGEWSGRVFESLHADHGWRRWNEARAHSRPPGGERIVDVQARVANHLDLMREEHPKATIAMVSHSDVIRAAICHVLGLSPDHWKRFEIDCASVTSIEADDEGYRLTSMNEIWS